MAEFSILMVCTGNVCRSPMAERLAEARLAARLGDPHPFSVSSVGVSALTGQDMQPGARVVLTERGVDADGFVARQATAEEVDSADLVLTATRAHRTAVLRMAPGSMRRTFTLRELGRLVPLIEPAGSADGPVLRAAAVVAQASAIRGSALASDPLADDVADPYLRPVEAFRECADLLSQEIDAILGALLPGRGAPSIYS